MYDICDELDDRVKFMFEHMLQNLYPPIDKNDVESVRQVLSFHILVNFKDGYRFIYCPYGDTVVTLDNPRFSDREQTLYEFRHILRYWMIAKATNQKQLADKVGCTEATMSRYVNGERIPDMYTLQKMALALGITADQFYFYY